MDVIGRRVKLKPGTLPRVREWAREVNARRAEVEDTLRNEGGLLETVFLEEAEDGAYLVYVMRVADYAASKAAFEASVLPIDQYHKEFLAAVVDSATPLELLADFDLIEPG